MKISAFVLPCLVLMLCIHSGWGARKREDPNKTTTSTTTTTIAPKTSATTKSTPPLKSVTEKVAYPKKVTSLKKRPSKTSKTPTPPPSKKAMELADTFKDLPADDLEFIKELDKQFKQHGDKIKIKVERDNSTTAKNSKRTIEGELGYGAQHNGYEYARPKFMFYPYSQSDIPADAPSYYPQHDSSSVTIEPSYSYELEPQTYIEEKPHVDLPHEGEQQHQQQQQYEGHEQQQQHGQQAEAHVPTGEQQHYDEPVIVLRIPGPAKYASHLQTLLQQYLEIRAAQYLRILEEAELRKQQQQQQPIAHEHHHQQQQQQEYEQPAGGHHQLPASEEVQQHQQQHYQQEVSYAHHQPAPAPQPVQYAPVDDVYQTYKHRQQQQQHQQQQHQQQHEQQHYQQQQQQHHQQQQQHYQPPAVPYYTEEAPATYQTPHQAGHQQQQQVEPQYYYMTPQQEYVHTHTHGDHSYQNVYFIAMSPQSAVYQEQQQYYDDSGSGEHLTQPISENNPRSSHTKIIFTPHQQDTSEADYSGRYPLPSIRPYDRHPPTSTPLYQQPQYEQQQHGAETAVAGGEESAEQEHHQEAVEITQRPFNYHAHVVRQRQQQLQQQQQQQHQEQQQQQHSKRGASPTATPRAVVASEGTVISERTATVSAQKADQQLEQIRTYVRTKLGAQMGSSVEYKTTKVVKA